MRQHSAVCNELFLSTPSARRATAPRAPLNAFQNISIHALREEGAPQSLREREQRANFYPRPPRGGRPAAFALQCAFPKFLSTPSARRATRRNPATARQLANFYPRPPRGGRPLPAGMCGRTKAISIHALREEGDSASHREHRSAKHISKHALREEGDEPLPVPA